MEILPSLISRLFPLSPRILNLKEEQNNSQAKSYNVHTVLNQLISICHKEIQNRLNLPSSTDRSHA